MFTIRRKRNACVPPHHHRKFAALAEHALKAPDLSVCEALNGIFTPPQIKRLIRGMGIDQGRPICMLNERQWGVVFHTMLEHVEPFRWPRQRR
jgi:23S rRNA (adenine-N6)-dimethyltransferase